MATDERSPEVATDEPSIREIFAKAKSLRDEALKHVDGIETLLDLIRREMGEVDDGG